MALGGIISFVPTASTRDVAPITSYMGTPAVSLRGAQTPMNGTSFPLAAIGVAGVAAASRTLRRAEAASGQKPGFSFNPAKELGAMAPLGYFDPLGLSKIGDEDGFRNLRAAELKHGRVAMLAALGLVVQHYVKFPGLETVPSGLAALTSFPSNLAVLYLLAIAGYLETKLWVQNPDKEPGNFGDPFGVNQYTQEMREKELNNGRFAMICAVGIMAAELATGRDAIQQFGWDLRTTPVAVQVQSSPKTLSTQRVPMKDLSMAEAPAVSADSAAPTPAPVVAAAPITPVAAAAPMPPPAPVAPVVSQPTELPMARLAASGLASGLRGAADAMPSVEKAFEAALPQAQSSVKSSIDGGIKWASDFKAENAGEKITDALPAVGQFAAETLKMSLKATSAVLGFAGEYLPAAGSALETATMKAMPMIQDATRATAGAVRGLADVATSEAGKQSSESSELNAIVLKSTPDVLRGAAAGLEGLADGLPGVNGAAAYLGSNVAVPVLKAGLTSASQLASDAANMPMPSMGEAEKKLLSTAVQDLASNASTLAQDAAANLQLAKKP